MRCQHCNKKEATTYIKQNINGKVTEMHLCSECAHELHADEMFEPFDMGSFFGNFLGAGAAALNSLAGVDRCSYCNSSFNDIVSNGKVGCAHCYDKFYDGLRPSLERIHGKAHHIGKNISYFDDNEKENSSAASISEIEKLKEELKEAVKVQNFEQAAILRDKIKELEEGKQNG